MGGGGLHQGPLAAWCRDTVGRIGEEWGHMITCSHDPYPTSVHRSRSVTRRHPRHLKPVTMAIRMATGWEATDELRKTLGAAGRSTVEVLGDGKAVALGLVVDV